MSFLPPAFFIRYTATNGTFIGVFEGFLPLHGILRIRYTATFRFWESGQRLLLQGKFFTRVGASLNTCSSIGLFVLMSRRVSVLTVPSSSMGGKRQKRGAVILGDVDNNCANDEVFCMGAAQVRSIPLSQTDC
jgi:hypothetical protein